MNLFELKRAYMTKQLTKPEFVKRMQEKHIILEDYMRLISGTGVNSITIEKERVLITTDDGVIMQCNFDDTELPLRFLSFGEYEKEERKIMLSMIKNGDTVFDIGANYGWYSLNIAIKYPSTAIYAFEPVKKTFDLFKKNVELNCLQERVRLFNIGIGKENGTLEFNYNKDQSGATSLTNLLDRDDVEKVRCAVETLDSFVAKQTSTGGKITKINFIKLDIEGAEYFALQGARDVLERFKPILFVEMLRKWSAKFNYHPNDIIRFMGELGYCCFHIVNGKLMPFYEMTEETISTNFFFLHKECNSANI